MTIIKKIIDFIVSIKLVRFIVKLAALIIRQYFRVYSYAKYRYFFPNGGDSFMHSTVEVKYPENIDIGNKVIVGPGCTLGAKSKIVLGDYVRISKDVTIETAGLDLDSELPYKHKSSPITIGKGVWLGTKTIVLGGVVIGDHSIIGAGSIISKDIPENSIVVGHGRIIGKRSL